MSEPKQILEAALRLDPHERARLIEELSASLDTVDLDEAWESEIQRRIEDVDSGRTTTIPGDEVFDRLRKRFGGS
jgi:putative addiction module component (TIGR02574 family)